MSWVNTTHGRQYLEGGQRVQLPSDERVYRHLHFDGKTSLNGATATLRCKVCIEPDDEFTVIRSCENGQDHEIPVGHLVVVKEKRPRRSDPLKDAIESWDRLIQFVGSGSRTF